MLICITTSLVYSMIPIILNILRPNLLQHYVLLNTINNSNNINNINNINKNTRRLSNMSEGL